MTFNIPEQKRDLYLKPSEQGMSGNLRYTWVLLSHVHLREAGLSGWLCPSVYHVCLIWNLSHQLLWLLRILWRPLSSQLASAIHARSIISLRIVSRFVHYLVGPIGFVSTFPISCKSWLPLEGLCLTRCLCSLILAPSVESYEELHAV